MPQDFEPKDKILRMATLINEPGVPVSFGCRSYSQIWCMEDHATLCC